jgi:hypothetical protein
MPNKKTLDITYRPHTLCKHSVRVTPKIQIEEDNIKLPDLYITHDVLQVLGIKPTEDFLLNVSFAKREV